ncbi:MAG: DUF2461 domain-containing protein [Oscillospiraceae bacterium]|nr:DUF2461 domain-containing protein [Oscillospiraceae bacterium]
MFEGFSKETGEFLWELSFNNERPWFLAHKEQFERVLNEPFRALARALYEELTRRFPGEDFTVHIARIYRDARRLFGRGPYKDHLWFTVTPVGAGDFGPSFWFEIGAAEYSYGLGLWAPTAPTMEAFRRAVSANPAAFERLLAPLPSMRGFALHGEEYRRPKGDLGETLNPWYNRKYLDFGTRRDHDALLYSSALVGAMAKDFERLMPLCRFMCEATRGAAAGAEKER